MERLEDDHGNLILDSRTDRRPVQLVEDWCDILMISSTTNHEETGSSILDGLQTTHPNDPGPKQQTVAVVEPTGDKCLNRRASG